MFQVGEKIAYPMYGAGTITDIVEKEVLGEIHKYYDVNLPHSKMTVLIPVESSARVGVRRIITAEYGSAENRGNPGSRFGCSKFSAKRSKEVPLHRREEAPGHGKADSGKRADAGGKLYNGRSR